MHTHIHLHSHKQKWSAYLISFFACCKITYMYIHIYRFIMMCVKLPYIYIWYSVYQLYTTVLEGVELTYQITEFCLIWFRISFYRTYWEISESQKYKQNVFKVHCFYMIQAGFTSRFVWCWHQHTFYYAAGEVREYNLIRRTVCVIHVILIQRTNFNGRMKIVYNYQISEW